MYSIWRQRNGLWVMPVIWRLLAQAARDHRAGYLRFTLDPDSYDAPYDARRVA